MWFARSAVGGRFDRQENNDPLPQETRRGVLGNRRGGRGAGGVSVELRASGMGSREGSPCSAHVCALLRADYPSYFAWTATSCKSTALVRVPLHRQQFCC